MKITIQLALLCAAAGLAPGQDRMAEFEHKFQSAREINSKDEMVKLVRQYQAEVVRLVVMRCESIPDGAANPLIEADIQALMPVWKEAFKSDFVQNYYEYCSLVDQSSWKERTRLGQAYSRAFKKYQENLEPKDPARFEMLAGEFSTLAVGFHRVGDLYYAAQSWGVTGNVSDAEFRGETADLYRACSAYKSCIEFCDQLGLNDGWYQSVKQRFTFLEANGYAGPPPDPNAPPPGAPVEAEGVAPIVATMAFEAIAALEAFERPSYFVDDVYQIWPSVYMKEKGTNGNFVTIGAQPTILRVGSSQLSLDLNADQQGDQEVPTKGNRTLVELPLGTGEEARRWAFLTEVGIRDDTYQGMRYNLQNDDNVFNLYYVNAASVVGSLNGVPLRVIDDNMDGIYGSEIKPWNWIGMPEGLSEPELDSIVVGETTRARPWSELQMIGGQWYKLAPARAGMALSATPVEVETGKLVLEYKGEAPAFVVVRGKEHLANSYFDLLQNGRGPVVVPIGEYELCYGIVRKGKKAQTMKALMLPGAKMSGWKVGAGETVEVTLGAPFGFDFEFEATEEQVTVKGKSVRIVGAAGEQYVRLWNCVPRPEVSWRKAGTKRGSKPEEMGVVMDIYERDDQGFYRYTQSDTFMPTDTSVEAKLKVGERAEVQLVDKKHKLFKVIESDWK
jgi:hypothetical protein